MSPTVTKTALEGVVILEPAVFPDHRGHFFESFNLKDFEAALSVRPVFVQDSQSCSVRNVVRGIHFQRKAPQAKLVRAISGEIFDVVVDVRSESPRFGAWIGVHLSAANRRQIWIPEGFGHGFVSMTPTAEVLYKVTRLWDPTDEWCLKWDDPDMGIEWPLSGPAIVSARDASGMSLASLRAEGRHGPSEGSPNVQKG